MKNQILPGRRLATSSLLLASTIVLTAIARAADYTITTTGNAIVVTDTSGNGETMAITEPSSGNIKFAVSGRTFSVDGAANTTGDSGSISLSAITSVTLNLGAGNDTANFGSFTSSFPSLTVNGDAGNDSINFNGNITFAADANLNVNLQDDTATPGVDAITVAGSKTLALSGTGSVDLRASQYVSLSGAVVSTVNGNIQIEGNQQATPTSGSFIGVDLASGGTIQSTGSGQITLKGRGGNSGLIQAGVRIGYVGQGGGNVLSGTGTITIVGTGGASSGQFYHRGVIFQGYSPAFSSIATSGGDINITGTGGGDGTSVGNLHIGVDIEGTSTARVSIQAGGTGSITINGTGGNTRNTGTGNATTLTSSYGVFNNGLIKAGGNISITGTGGTGTASQQFDNVGTYLAGSIQSTAGSVSITGVEGAGTSTTQPATGLVLGAVSCGSTGSISLTANSAKLGGSINAGTRPVTILPYTSAVPIDLGGTTDPVGGPLTLSSAEYNNITAGTINIGDANSGAMTVSAAVSRSGNAVVNLTSGGAISFNGGGLTSAGGNVNLTAGSTITAANSSTDVNMSSTGTLAFHTGSTLGFALNGTTVDTQYQQLNVIGKVNLTGVTLSLSGSYVPFAGDSFTLIANDGTDAVTGTFTGLAEGATFTVGGSVYSISYVGGSGNDVVLSSLGSAVDIAVSQGGALTDGVSSVSFGSVAVGATGSTRTFTITNPGLSAPLTGLQVTVDGANAGDFSVGTLSGTSIAAGSGSATFTVTFNPSATGSRTAALHIASDNAPGSRNPFDISLSGTGLNPNVAPVAVGDTLVRSNNTKVAKVLKTVLTANDTDADSDPLTIIAVGNPLPSGATVTLAGGFVVYTAPTATAGNGSFTYTLSDGSGGHTTTGTVTVLEVSATANSGDPNAVRIVASGTDFIVYFIGVPGNSYRVQYSTSTSSPYTWNEFSPLATYTAPDNAVFIHTDVNPPDAARFYRAIPNP